MKKIIAIILYVAVILLFGRFCLSYFYNQYVLDEYKAGNYSINEDLLLSLNIIEPYIVHYNNANILYQNMLYEDAIKEYEMTLSYKDLPEDRECRVRINLALCYVAMLPQDYDSIDNIDDSIANLYTACEVLTENGCAKDGGGGHSSRAQTLYDELMAKIEELENYRDNHPDRIINHVIVDKTFENATDNSALTATFVIRYEDINADNLGTLIKDESIYSYESVLQPGTYYVIETESPEGYFTADSVSFTVAADKTITVENLPEGITASVSENGYEITFAIMNTAVPTPAINHIEVDKTFQEDPENPIPEGTELVCTFEIRSGSQDGPQVGVLDRDGNIYTYEGHLDEGMYFLVESESPEGYGAYPPILMTIDMYGVITVVPPEVGLDYTLSDDGIDVTYNIENPISEESPDPSDPSEPPESSETQPETQPPTEPSDEPPTIPTTASETETNFTDFESSIHSEMNSIMTGASIDRITELEEYSELDHDFSVNPGCW